MMRWSRFALLGRAAFGSAFGRGADFLRQARASGHDFLAVLRATRFLFAVTGSIGIRALRRGAGRQQENGHGSQN